MNVVDYPLVAPRQRIMSRSMPGIHLASYPPAHRIDFHAHTMAKLTLLVQGSWTEYTEAGRYQATPGSICQKTGHAAHAVEVGSVGATSIVICLDKAPPSRYAWIEDHGFSGKILQLLEDSLACRCSAAEMERKTARLRASLTADMAKACHRNATAPEWLQQSCRLLEKNRVESPCTVREIATTLDVSFEHYSRVFRKFYGRSPTGYRRMWQVKRAMTLLANTERVLSLVALDCGFADQPHFHRVFRKELGLTPRQFRCHIGNFRTSLQTPDGG